MGSKGSGGGTNTVTSNSAPPPAVMANYTAVTGQAQNVAATPYQAYTGQEVAPLNAQQTAAGTEAANAVGSYQPYFNQAQGMIANGTQAITPSAVNASTIGQYESPYNQDVINATEAQMNQNDQTQQQQLTGNAIAAGAFGGDRQAVAASTLAGQQDLANNSTIAGLENSNYTQALGEANTQQQTGMTAQQATAANQLQASGLTGALGNYASTNNLNEASANEAAGQVAQQTTQAGDTAAYQQFEQALQYPFQTTGWLAGIDTGTGGASGGTSSTTSPGPSIASQITGLGEFGLGAYGAATSNKRGGPIRGYASGGSPSSDMPDFSVSYVPNAPSFGGGSSMLKPSGSQSTTTGGQPQGSPMALQLAGKGLGHLMGPSGSSGPSGGLSVGNGNGIAQTEFGPEQVGVEYPVGESATGAATGAAADTGAGIAGDLGIDGGANAGIMGDITGAGDWGASGLMDDLAGASGFEGIDAAADAGIMGGIDAGVAEGALDAGVADAGLATAGEAAMDVAPALMFAKRGGPIKGYASGGSTSAPNYPLTYLLQNPTLGSNMNSIMGGGYGGALSGLGPTSPGYSSGGGIMPKKYASAGFVPPPLSSGSGSTGDQSIPYDTINNMSGMGYNDPTASFNWGNSPSDFTPMPTQSMASAPTAQGIPAAPSIGGQSTMGTNGPMSTSGIGGTPSTDDSGTTTIAGVPALGSSSSGQPQDLTDLEAKLQANAPVLDKNEALMRAGLATMAGTNPHALTNIGAGGLQGVEDYSQQKAAVRDYGLKEAEVEDRAKQMQVEADRFKAQQDMAQKNYEVDKNYKEGVVANNAQKVPVNDQIYAGLKAKQAASNGAYTEDMLNADYAKTIQGTSIPRNSEIYTATQIAREHPEYTPEQVAAASSQALATGTQNAQVNSTQAKAADKDFAKSQQKWVDSQSAANTNNTSLIQLQKDLAGWTPGAGAVASRKAKEAYQTFAQTAGIDTPDLDKGLGNQQAANKTLMKSVLDATRQASPRAAYAEMQAVGSSFQNETMSKPAWNIIMAQQKAGNDFTGAMSTAMNDPDKMNAWASAHNGNMTGYENSLLNNINPAAFWIKNLDQNGRQEVKDNLIKSDPAAWNKIVKSMDYINKNGLSQ